MKINIYFFTKKFKPWNKSGIGVVGKGTWKKREVGKFYVGTSDIKLARMKLEGYDLS